MPRPVLALAAGIIVFAAMNVSSEIKMGVLNKETILVKYEGLKEVQLKLDKQEAEWEQNLSKSYKEIRDLQALIDKQSLLLSAERKKLFQDSLQQMLTLVHQEEQKKFSPGGEWYTKNKEIYAPVVEKINHIIEKIAKDESFDFIFDAKAGGVVYAMPKYDLTDRVLTLLNKEK
jgi:outer membrane protein